ncbi:sensor histidine kinase [Cohnella faecalis]|uniref:histidine kinase n=1 Tax=Cohnella faecalis TaxID=2315694 RepID=A0A398CU07_9BACL|nr:HAMP domain-containing sensor histidine kinase [Cohnella faecalis]RIE02801.1 sensor histidine kinase [Cohnella faecalis]
MNGVGVSIKLKNSLFLAALLFLTVLVLSILVLNGISNHQRDSMEQELLTKTKTANISVKQAYLTTGSNDPQRFIRNRGQQLALDLALYSDLHVVLYDMNGKKAGDSLPQSSSEAIDGSLRYALKGKIAYQAQGESIFYLAPLQGPDSQMGVLQFEYSTAGDRLFHRTIAGLFVAAGAAVLAVSFALGYVYFKRSATSIAKLNRAVDRIREGEYPESRLLRRRDELGKLGQGITYMGLEIRRSMEAMKAEENKLRRALAKLEQLGAAQRQFIGNFSHEFKTPLTSIKAYVELMEMYPDDRDMQTDAVMRIGRETERLYEMVEKVLRLASLEKYDFEFHAQELEIREELLAIIDRMKAKANRFQVKIEEKLAPAHIWADRESLNHIFINLLDNAIKYNVPGGQAIVTGTVEDRRVVVEVKDTGIGIPEEARAHLFEPFYTVNKDRSRLTGGTGLGLSLVKVLVERHGGTIEWLESKTGTVFRVIFPLYTESGESV